MRAMVLAAGLGTRLRPMTENKPKCMLPLAGRPLIEWTLKWLRSSGVEQCIINLHHCTEKVRKFIGDGNQFGLHVFYSYEPVLLGTAGALKKVADFFKEPFYVVYSDNFSQWDISKLKTAYECNSTIATVAVHWRKDVTQSGMVEMDKSNRISRLIEKPDVENVTSHYVNAGFYYMNPKVFDYIKDGEFCDFGFHVFPAMIRAGEQIYAVKVEERIIGIDTEKSYKEADEFAGKLKNAQ